MILLLVIAATLFITGTAAQNPRDGIVPVDPESGKIMYREVVEQSGTPAYLYDRAIEWFGYYYVNAQSVYSVQDKTNGKIEGVGRMKIYRQDENAGVKVDAGLITYTIRLELRDNKYRYTITDFNLKSSSRFPIEKWLNKTDPAYNPNWDVYLYQIDTTMQRLTSSLIEKMKPVVKKTDEW